VAYVLFAKYSATPKHTNGNNHIARKIGHKASPTAPEGSMLKHQSVDIPVIVNMNNVTAKSTCQK